MSAWVQEVEAADIVDDKIYFIALRRVTRMTPYMFWSEYLSGKTGWSKKPGLACQYDGSAIRASMIDKAESCVAVLVPRNADKLWRSRKKRFRR